MKNSLYILIALFISLSAVSGYSQKTSIDTLITGKYYEITFKGGTLINAKVLGTDSVFVKILTTKGTTKIYKEQIESAYQYFPSGEIELDSNRKYIGEVNNPVDKAVWFEISAGMAGALGDKEIGFGTFNVELGMSYSKHNIVELKFTTGQEYQMFGGKSPVNSVSDLSVLYGLASESELGRVSAAAGLGLVWGTKRGSIMNAYYSTNWFFGETTYDSETYFTVGIPVELKAQLHLMKFVGIGLTLSSNINAKRPYIGGTINLQFGVLN